MDEAEILIEGRTEHRLPPAKEERTEKQLERHGKGPADRAHRSAFHNPAMARLSYTQCFVNGLHA